MSSRPIGETVPGAPSAAPGVDRPWRSQFHLFVLIVWAAGTALLLSLYARPSTTPIVEDELYWIGSAYYFHLATTDRGWSHPDWHLLPARENPPVAKYLIGLSLWLDGKSIRDPDLLGTFYALFESVPHAWGEGNAHARRAAVVSRMNADAYRAFQSTRAVPLNMDGVAAARRGMIVLVTFTSLAVLVLGWAAANALVGLLASQALLVHPAVVSAYNHALSDAAALFFSTVAAGLVFLVHRRWVRAGPTPAQPGGLLLTLTAAAIALACGAKMNALVVVVLALLLAVHAAWRGRREPAQLARLAGTVAVVAGLSLLFFIALNPALWRDPFAGLADSVREHRLTEAIQARFLSDHLSTWAGKLRAVADLAYFGPWGGLVFVGIAATLLLRRGPGAFTSVWGAAAFLCVTLWIPFPRDRYVLPVIVPSLLVASEVLVTAIRHAAQRGRTRAG